MRSKMNFRQLFFGRVSTNSSFMGNAPCRTNNKIEPFYWTKKPPLIFTLVKQPVPKSYWLLDYLPQQHNTDQKRNIILFFKRKNIRRFVSERQKRPGGYTDVLFLVSYEMDCISTEIMMMTIYVLTWRYSRPSFYK